jgi:2-polyprenyl-3-methyl-5-hydroxy-6-metoxy-1,4-benzoquinol methylase
VTPRRCPLCDGANRETLAEVAAAAVVSGNSTYRADALRRLNVAADARYPIVRCTRCGFVFAAFVPDFLRVLYDDVIDPEAARRESQSPSWVGHQLRLASLLLEKLGGERVRVLDYGCGYGAIVRALQGPSIECVGYEPSPSASEAAHAKTSLDEIEGSFDGVILSDVLEHVPEPLATLAECRARLRSGGWICVSVPDFSPRRLRDTLADAAAGRPFTRELNPWEHLNYFSPSTLAQMLARAGFDADRATNLDFGFRPDTAGVRRVGNAVKSALRLGKFAIDPRPLTTTLLARVTGA